MRPAHTENPFNAIPTVVLILVVAIGGIEIVFQLAERGLLGGASGVGWRIEALNAFAFSPALFDRMVETNTWPPRALLRFVSYAFVHYNFTHVLFVLVFLLALGKMVAETFSSWAVVVVLAASAIGGALGYALLAPGQIALVGGYPAVYGLIGAYTFILWVGLGAAGQNRSRAFTLIAFLLGIQLAFGLLFGGGYDWIADLSGFATGFAMSFLVSPGGWHRVMQRLRQR
ncbi:rhomboid family protein [Palleronia aestuarii]|uniref:Rhomboid family protein n=1 Tax=Palleronia aestuarii TaxID=568105 RepID=A0A2W7NEP2_9RHOB|nr:rhomboid family intramembrane serine protease [Palleronia aestuarii]PZX18390.1 rhomboid family protein [Palleronia aestuarii]